VFIAWLILQTMTPGNVHGRRARTLKDAKIADSGDDVEPSHVLAKATADHTQRFAEMTGERECVHAIALHQDIKQVSRRTGSLSPSRTCLGAGRQFGRPSRRRRTALFCLREMATSIRNAPATRGDRRRCIACI